MKSNLSYLKKKILLIFILGIMGAALVVFIPAGTLNYWQAWVFILSLFIPMSFVMIYFLKHDPALLLRRFKIKEKESTQSIIIILSNTIVIITVLIAVLDYRFKWSNVPTLIVLLSDLVIVSGYMLIFLVFKENSYTSRIIEVYKNQKVISTGPYAVVRHPMYVGVILMLIAMPTALGSYLALLGIIPVIALIILRIIHEEKLLRKNLKGYNAYCNKVNYRLIPNVW